MDDSKKIPDDVLMRFYQRQRFEKEDQKSIDNGREIAKNKIKDEQSYIDEMSGRNGFGLAISQAEDRIDESKSALSALHTANYQNDGTRPSFTKENGNFSYKLVNPFQDVDGSKNIMQQELYKEDQRVTPNLDYSKYLRRQGK